MSRALNIANAYGTGPGESLPGDPRDQRIEALEAALRPFAEAHRWLEASGMSSAMREQYEASISVTRKFTVTDMKRAAELV